VQTYNTTQTVSGTIDVLVTCFKLLALQHCQLIGNIAMQRMRISGTQPCAQSRSTAVTQLNHAGPDCPPAEVNRVTWWERLGAFQYEVCHFQQQGWVAVAWNI
jgi:hypothetical protein